MAAVDLVGVDYIIDYLMDDSEKSKYIKIGKQKNLKVVSLEYISSQINHFELN